MQSDCRVDIGAVLHPDPVLRPRPRCRRHGERHYTLFLAVLYERGRIGVQIDVAMKIKAPDGPVARHAASITTASTIAPTSAIPRENTAAYSPISSGE